MTVAASDTVISFCTLCVLLVSGKMCRIKIRLFQQLYLPSSVIAGLLGLLVLQIVAFIGNPKLDHYFASATAGWDHLAGFLINIVFSSLFLGTHIPKVSVVWEKAGPQLMYGMVVAWGQWLVAILVTGALLIPMFNVHPLFASILPVGFAGGHGTAAGLTDTYKKLGMEDGGDYGLASATVGLVFSITLGVVWVNIAAKKGWVVKDKMDSAASSVLSIRAGGVYPTDNRPIAGVQTVSPDSIDALAWHLAVIGIAMLIGYVIKVVFIAIEGTSVALQDVGFLSGFPLFPLCMCGGIMIQLGLERFNRDHKLVDARLMERLSGTSLDFLITAAVASVNMSAIGANIVPFFILILSGVFWHFFAIGLLARHFLPNHWFERSIAEFGMTMGIIASGLVLLRMVDPESKSPVAADFAYKQLLHSPFMGGGIWTCLSLPLLAKAGIWVSFVVVGIVFIGWVLLGLFVMKPKYEMHCACNVCSNLGAGDPIYASSSHSLNGGSGSVVSSDGRRSGSGREISTSVSLGEPLLRGDGSDDIAASTDRVSNMESLVRSSDMMIESKQEQLRENRTFSHDSNGL